MPSSCNIWECSMFDQINRVSVKLSGYCNLACEYCHQLNEDKKSHDVFSDFDGLIRFLSQVNLESSVEVTLTGGEITQCPELYEKAVKAFKRIERKIPVKFVFSVVSNGTNLPCLFDWIKRGILTPRRTAISWDGLHTASLSRHSKSREYTDEFFLRMISELGQSEYASDICVTHAVAPSTLPFLAESFKYAVSQNIKNIGHYYIHEANYSDPALVDCFNKELTKISQLFVERYASPKERFIYWNYQLLWSKLNLKPEDMIASTMCQKLGRTLHIDPNGDVYGCIYFGDHRAFRLGTIKDGINQNILEAFIQEYREAPHCNLDACTHHHCFECPAANYVAHGSMSKRFMNTCELLSIEKTIFLRALSKITIHDFDIENYWMDQDHLGDKDYYKKINNQSIGIPITDVEVGSLYQRPSQALKHVTHWMLPLK